MKGMHYKSLAAMLVCGSLGTSFAAGWSSPAEMSLPATKIVQQARTVTGVVLDKENVPIIGATVVVEGTYKGVISDLDGKYSLDVPAGEKKLESFLYRLFNCKCRRKFSLNGQCYAV